MITFVYWSVCMIALVVFFSAILFTVVFAIWEIVELIIRDDCDD